MHPLELPRLLEGYEGIVLVPYDDGAHKATIGLGINITLPEGLVLVLRKLGVFAADDANHQTDTEAQRNTRYQKIVSAFAKIITDNKLTRPLNSTEARGAEKSEEDLKKALDVELKKTGLMPA
jgi:GH24 family phage-related lysozyme (muramidase)